MFGRDKDKNDEGKKEEEEKKKQEEEDKKKQEEEEKKKEEEKKDEGKPEEAKPAEGEPAPAEEPEPSPSPDSGLGGLKNISSSPANSGDTPKDEASEPAAAKEADTDSDKPPEEEPPKEEPATAGPDSPEEPASEPEKPKKKNKAPLSDMEKMKKQIETQKESLRELEKEKRDAMKKSDELAGLIEELSSEIKEVKAAPVQQAAQQPPPQMPDIGPKLKEIQEKTAAQMKQMQDALVAMTQKKDEDKKDEEDVAATMKKMFDKRLKELSDKLEETKAKPAPGTEGQAAAGGEVAGGLSAIGGGVEFKKEVDSLKKSLKDLATLLDAFKEEAENRFMAIDREMQVVERFPDLEQKMEMFGKKLGPENVQRLRLLISSADDLKEEVIPLVVKRVVEDKVEPHTKQVKRVADEEEKNREKMNEILTEMKNERKDIENLYKFGDRIGKLEETSDGMKRLLAELKASMKEMDKSQRQDVMEKVKEMFPKLIEAESSSLRKELASRFAFIEEKLQSVENMAAEAHKDIAALSVLKGEIEALHDRMDDLADHDEKTDMRIEALRDKDKDLLDKLEDMETPKEVITELDNKTKDILDIREFFVRRANQLDERINQLDERAVPAQKLHDRVGKLTEELKALQEGLKGLDQRVSAENKQFQEIVKQHAKEKRELEGKLSEQKTRIGVLLKEFR